MCNVAVSVLHPAFVGLYIDQALPSLVAYREWPELWMPGALAAWLQKCRGTIQQLDEIRGRQNWALAELFMDTQRSLGSI